jgi:uncharacterized protein YwbE
MPTVVTGLVAASLAASPSLVTSAPELRQVTNHYEGTVATTTDVALNRYGGQYGHANGATVTVSRTDSGDGQPNGRVRIQLVGVETWTVRLSGGGASVDFPRRLPAGESYTVRASYLPPDGSLFHESSGTAYYTVVQARTTTAARAADIRVGEVARARVSVDSETGLTPRGSVRAVLTRNGDRVDAVTVDLEDGAATARFGQINRRGTYDVSARFLSGDNFKDSTDETTFSVRRR